MIRRVQNQDSKLSMKGDKLPFNSILVTSLLLWSTLATVYGMEPSTDRCSLSRWETTIPCEDPVRCRGQRTDSQVRSCPGSEDETEERIVECDGKCKPCTEWSDWSRPCAQKKGDTYGFERRHRFCHFQFLLRRNNYEYRQAVCLYCNPCGLNYIPN